MAAEFLKIAVTPPLPRDDEAARAEAVLRSGWDFVHLRFPDATTRAMRDVIEGISQRFHHRLVLHGHFDLVKDFNLGALHLNSRCPAPPANYSGSLSRSCHSVRDVEQAAAEGCYRYVTLSPVLESVSKAGYGPSLSREEFRRAIAAAGSMPVVALGGVTPEAVPALRKFGFGGIAVLGSLASAATIYELEQQCKAF